MFWFEQPNGVVYPIRHDRREEKWAVVCGAVCTIMEVAAWSIVFCSEQWDFPQSDIVDYMALLVIFLPSVIAAIWIYFGDIKLYFSMLKKYGYEVPADKRQYQGDLTKLPRKMLPLANEKRNKSSLLLCVLSVFALQIPIGYLIYVVCEYGYLGFVADLVAGAALIAGLFWMIYAYVCYRESDNTKYRDEVELNGDRKVRRTFVSRLIEMIVLVLLMYLFFCMMENMIGVVIKARIAAGML